MWKTIEGQLNKNLFSLKFGYMINLEYRVKSQGPLDLLCDYYRKYLVDEE